MKITILGCHSASPRNNARPTAQLLEMRGHLFLIDCGEGTQVALRNSSAKFARIKHIFISHLHGDHFFGLPGLISTFQHLGREAELHIYAPKGAKEAILLLLKISGARTTFPLFFHELNSLESEIILEDEKLSVRTIPLDHRIYANGFLFQEKEGERKLNVDAVQTLGIDMCYYQNIKLGKDVILDNGTLIPNERLSFPPAPPQSYAFCSDTAYLPDIVNVIKNTRVLYHEATFLQHHLELAEKTKHSTALQAAQIAKMANVETLILGHYSSRYSDKNLYKEEAQAVFANVFLSEDGKDFIFEN
ncbi:MAG: ribonuclease Z [Capnocytophaga sp.]|nr:ribonuclease Z [Capnocytophaga sp.]